MTAFKAELQQRRDAKRAAADPAPLLLVVSPGPRNARTDSSGLRFYTWRGRELPSVTTIRRLAGIPWGLHQWSVSRVIERAVTEADELQRMLTRERRPRERVLEKNRMEEASRWLRLAATEERDAAAELGTAVHDAAAAGLDPMTVDEAVRPRLLQFRDWLAASKPEILATEFQVWNLTEGYAGTGDLLCRFTDGSVWLIDLKTGKGTYSEHLLQVLNYAMGEFVGSDDVIDQPLTDMLRSVSGVAVLHLADDHWEFKRLEVTPEAWTAARGLLRFAMWMHEHPDIGDVTLAVRRGSA